MNCNWRFGHSKVLLNPNGIFHYPYEPLQNLNKMFCLFTATASFPLVENWQQFAYHVFGSAGAQTLHFVRGGQAQGTLISHCVCDVVVVLDRVPNTDMVIINIHDRFTVYFLCVKLLTLQILCYHTGVSEQQYHFPVKSVLVHVKF